MQGDNNLKSYLNLHLIVFIWGFTAVLGELITIREASLVWYRMLLATGFLLVYLLITKKKLLLPPKAIMKLVFVGFLIAIHWIFFFKAINISNVSITLAMFSVGAFFASVLEPLFYKRKMLWYEVLFGLIIIAGLFIIMQVEIKYLDGILAALFSVFVGVLFTLFNGKLIQQHDSTIITLYEFFAGFLFVSVYLLFDGKFTPAFFEVSTNDWLLILLLSSVCTAYAFTASVNVMKRLSPYTVMLTTNLEPVYGIILAYFIIGEDEKMSVPFYIGSAIILLTVILNGIIKNKYKAKE
ncbi:drug/metabolite transporter (DMT)-like permease [Flavobacterium arsenatis]|uniref:Drug/metabolite transporter (DMT)-like permease n=1 Tax=Flavobacterium arsenatis TaxID=1484332 RepID=A0ABU1TSG1_9FLAO|nr:DMT family transporter [Flavobacterium arsenatis]MDR6968794.1 drug/metabolite transporter (DMT)-like permease [Flavobacterium arsenatis]